MTAIRNGFESGFVGQNVNTTTSAGANDTALTPNVGGAATITYSADIGTGWPLHGDQSAKYHAVAGQPCYLSYALSSVSSDAVRHGFWFKNGVPLSAALVQIRNTSGDHVMTFGTSGTGKMVLQDNSGTTIWTSTNVMPTTPVVVEIGGAKGTTSSNGTLKVAVYAGNSTTALESGPTTPTARNAGTVVFTEVRVGKCDTTSWAVDFYGDTFFNTDASTGPIGYSAPTFPGKPTDVAGSVDDGQIPLAWTAPNDNGSSSITKYKVTPYIAGVAQTAQTFVSTAVAQTIVGLTNGTAYQFGVQTGNSSGFGDMSALSPAVTPISGSPTVDGGTYLFRDGDGWVAATESLLVQDGTPGGTWV